MPQWTWASIPSVFSVPRFWNGVATFRICPLKVSRVIRAQDALVFV